MSMKSFDLGLEIKRIKEKAPADKLGMILVHNGVVRATSKEGDKSVAGMVLSYDHEALDELIKRTREENPGVVDIVAWINEGKLSVGDDIMYLIVAGDRRSNLLPVFESLIEQIKGRIVKETELPE